MYCKAETINRLLKKQSRPRGKRNALSTAEDRLGPGEAAGEGEEEEIVETLAPPPTMYRWVSSVRSTTPAEGEAGEATPERAMTLSFSVPVAALPSKRSTGNAMEVDGDSGSLLVPPPPRLPPAEPPKCDVQGCTSLRKYRLVRDFQKGACGLSHLKALEAQFA